MRHILTIALLSCISVLATAQGIVQAEYFWDSDPGEGNATSMTAEDDSFDAAVEAILAEDVGIPTSGNHTFNIRVQDENGGWSPVFSTVIQVEPELEDTRDITVTQGEYFWDTDPGEGNGTTLIAFDGDFDSALETALGENLPIPGVGVHQLNVRVLDAESSWSPVFGVVIDIVEELTTVREINVSAAEYFWDNDPGQGNGSPLLAFDNNFDDAVESLLGSDIGIPEEGTHVLNIRTRDAENAWSTPFGVVIEIEPKVTTVRDVEVTAGEYYFDNDPGEGNGTPMLALDGNFNSAIEAIKGGAIPTPIVEGIHVLWMRAKDAENNWGPSFGVVVNMDTTITGFEAVISGPMEFCEGDNLLGAVYSAQAADGSTYSWSVTNGVIISGQGTPTVTVNWNPSGTRTVTLEQCIDANCQTDQIELTIFPSYTLDDELTICQGDSALLGGMYQSQPGEYTDIFETVNGCDSVVVTELFVVDEIVVNTEAAICEGESIILGGEPQTEAGTYTDVYESSAGCDSLVVTELTVHPTYYMDDAEAYVCPGDSVFLGGAYQTVPGAYTDVFQSEFGCDSIVVTTLVAMDNPEPVIAFMDNLLETVESYDSYQWYFNGAVIDGATNATHVPEENGEYSVVVTDSNGCEGVSDEFAVISLGSEEIANQSEVLVYPNPTSGFLQIEILSESDDVHSIQLIDITGRVVNIEGTNTNPMTLDLSGYSRGTYSLRLIIGERTYQKRIVLM